MTRKSSGIETMALAALFVCLIIGVGMGFGLGSVGRSSGSTVTTTESRSFTSTLVSTSFSVSDITFPREVSTLLVPQTTTLTQTATVTTPSTLTQTATITSVSTQTTTLTQTTLIIYSQTATTSATTNGQITTNAVLATTGAIYPGSNATVAITVNNGVGQILNMTFTPAAQSGMVFYPATFSKIVPPGASTFSFLAKATGYSSQAPSVSYLVSIAEDYTLNGNQGSITSTVDIPISNPLTVSAYSLSGALTGSCAVRSNPNSIGDYYCSLSGSPNQTGSIAWTGSNQGTTQACLTWLVISPVVQVIAQTYGQGCTSNGQSGYLINPGQWNITFSLGVPSSASSQTNSVEFVWA